MEIDEDARVWLVITDSLHAFMCYHIRICNIVTFRRVVIMGDVAL